MRSQRTLFEIHNDTKVVELLPPWTLSLRAPGYGQNPAGRHCKATGPCASGTVSERCPRLSTALFSMCSATMATGPTGDPLSQPHTNIPCVRTSGGREKVGRRGRGATRGLHPLAKRGAGGMPCTPLVLCKLAGKKQMTLTPALALGLLIPPGMPWESAAGTPGEPLQPPWAWSPVWPVWEGD